PGTAAPTPPPLTSTSPPPVASAPPTAVAPVVTQPEGNYLRLRITTNPVQTRLLLDGTPLPPESSPFEGKFVKDGAVHRITAEATGFYPQSRMIVFDRDQQLEFFLHSKKPGLPPPKDNPY